MRVSKHERSERRDRRGKLVAGKTGADLLDQAADNVADSDVGLLNALGILGRNIDEQVHARRELTASFSRHADDERAAGAAGFGATENIGTFAARRDGDEDVPGRNKGFDLAGKNGFEAEIVCGGGEDRRVRRECKGREAGATALKADDEFGSEVLGIGGAAAIAEEDDLATMLERSSRRLGEA